MKINKIIIFGGILKIFIAILWLIFHLLKIETLTTMIMLATCLNIDIGLSYANANVIAKAIRVTPKSMSLSAASIFGTIASKIKSDSTITFISILLIINFLLAINLIWFYKLERKMKIWKQEINLFELNQRSLNTLAQHLDIKFVEIGDNYLKATMPVEYRTKQPIRLLQVVSQAG